MNKFSPKSKKTGGYALIFSVVIIGVIVVVTLAISALVQKGLELSSIGQQSMEAFFAADAGVECVLLNDIGRRSAGEEGVFPRDPVRTTSLGFINCGSGDIAIKSYSVGGGYWFRTSSPYCAHVVVLISGNDTTIKSTGYYDCITSGPGAVERGLEVHY